MCRIDVCLLPQIQKFLQKLVNFQEKISNHWGKQLKFIFMTFENGIFIGLEEKLVYLKALSSHGMNRWSSLKFGVAEHHGPPIILNQGSSGSEIQSE